MSTHQDFATMLAVDGHKNSLGKAEEVVALTAANRSRLEELYICLSDDDAWVRMRAADALEKLCRQQPDWLDAYIDRLLRDHTSSSQASIQWHLAQIFRQVKLSKNQRQQVISWLQQLLLTDKPDWIVASEAMETLATFARTAQFDTNALLPLLQRQHQHQSKAVAKRASKLLDEFRGRYPKSQAHA